VLQFLQDWLSDHILVNDKKYAPFLIGAGVR
jgi:hemerythrin